MILFFIHHCLAVGSFVILYNSVVYNIIVYWYSPLVFCFYPGKLSIQDLLRICMHDSLVHVCISRYVTYGDENDIRKMLDEKPAQKGVICCDKVNLPSVTYLSLSSYAFPLQVITPRSQTRMHTHTHVCTCIRNYLFIVVV